MIKRNIISIIMVMLIILNMIPASIAVGNNVKTMNDEKELNENKSFVENIDEIAYDFLNDDCRILNYIDNETFDADSFAHRLRIRKT